MSVQSSKLSGQTDFTRYVDHRSGLIKRDIFVDDDIYRAELKRIFARCWLYLCHESQLAKVGDYVHVYMGEEPVIVARHSDNKIHAFINSCRHRGNRVCRSDHGNTRSFFCSYHGWSYNTRGELIGVPGKSDLYNNEIDMAANGLVRVAQIDSYKGLVFGTFDAEAPSLDAYLGDMRWGLDLLLDQGDFVAVPGIVKWPVQTNWKFASDNAIGDFYHGFWSHRSAMLAGHLGGGGATQSMMEHLGAKQRPGFTLMTKFGHGLNADYCGENTVDLTSPLNAWRVRAEVKDKLGPMRSRVHRANMNVFPNLFVNAGARDLMIRNPRGPGKTEIWKTVLVDRNDPPEIQRELIRATNRHFGPSGMFEQDDGENWDQSTAAARGPVARDYDLNYSMGLKHAQFESIEGSPPVTNLVNEHAQIWMYRCWAEYLNAADWNGFLASHKEPADFIGGAGS